MDNEAPKRSSALMRLLFPKAARALDGMHTGQTEASQLQAQLDKVLNYFIADIPAGTATADSIIAAAEKLLQQKQAAFWRELQEIDPELVSVDAVRLKLQSIAALTLKATEDEVSEEVSEGSESSEVSDGFETTESTEDTEISDITIDDEEPAEEVEAEAEEQPEAEAKPEPEVEAEVEAEAAPAEPKAAEEPAAAIDAAAEQIAQLQAEHEEEIARKDEALEKSFRAYVDLLKFMMKRVMEVGTAYIGTNPSSPVALAISQKIVKNDAYGLEDFDTDLDAAINDSGNDPDSLNARLRMRFQDCLEGNSSTWLNVLTRFYLYGQVPFVREALENQGLNMDQIDRSFLNLSNLLEYCKIDLLYPRLFEDNYDPKQHALQSVRNIDAYVTGIEDHCGEDTIVDLYLVGYDDGRNQRKPMVSKFS